MTPADHALPDRAQAPLRVAIIGGGKMAQQHIRALLRVQPAVDVVAVADPADASRHAALSLATGARGFSSLTEVLSEAAPDVVHIVTPPATHFALIREALEAGVHVYAEKPVVERHAEIVELLALAERRGLLLCPGHQLLFEQPARDVVALLPGLGRVVHVESYFAFRPVRRMPGGRAPLRADLQLLDILPHPVYLLLHVLGRLAPGETPAIETLQVGADGTVHGLLRAGSARGVLTVTLSGRPVDSYLRVVGTNGCVHADFVRGVTTRLIGPGTSGIDKALAPFRLAWQQAWGTTRALTARVIRRQRSYPGLRELFESMHVSIRSHAPHEIRPETIEQTVRVGEAVAEQLAATEAAHATRPPQHGALRVAITGGTGMLGRAVAAEALARGHAVRILARRLPAPWERLAGVEYRVADLGAPLESGIFAGCGVVIHAAAETAGGWDDHERNSIGATRHVIERAASDGVRGLVHVSSTAVLRKVGSRPLDEATPLEPNERGSGPYVWGKLVSERVAAETAAAAGMPLRIVRPSAIVNFAEFDPPGRLGKRLGGLFVAVGSLSDRLPIVELNFAACTLVWFAENFGNAPDVLNLVNPELPSKRELLDRLRIANPGISVLRLPFPLLRVIDLLLRPVQLALRPGRPAVRVAKVFAVERYDARLAADVARRFVATPAPEAGVLASA